MLFFSSMKKVGCRNSQNLYDIPERMFTTALLPDMHEKKCRKRSVNCEDTTSCTAVLIDPCHEAIQHSAVTVSYDIMPPHHFADFSFFASFVATLITVLVLRSIVSLLWTFRYFETPFVDLVAVISAQHRYHFQELVQNYNSFLSQLRPQLLNR
ncbi:hypothetical protein LOAG_11028 [Loa loa]|uniref:Uncharacterized protein n=1 Tax=Loa loa TaxID=7209 RepID=A0A1S0TNS5_LOALO|nr:hypothetical protein LOAG_11028 [Loa loa]EFO17470.1 hypothetical protein LOAG_11028 [Loa loa]